MFPTIPPVSIPVILWVAEKLLKDKEDDFERRLQAIEESNRKAMDEALGLLRKKQEMRDAIQSKLFDAERTLQGIVNQKIGELFDQQIKAVMEADKKDKTKLVKLEADMKDLSGIERETRDILAVVQLK